MGQLAPFDFVIIIALGSAVGDPMFYPDVPVLHGMAAITVVVVLTRLVGFLTERSRRFENLVEARPACLVRDGVMDLDAMESENIPRDELFQRLRTEGMEQLGQVDRAYIEPSGRVSVFRVPSDAPPTAGIPLVPQVEEDVVERFCAGGPVPTSGAYACWRCGHPVLLTEGSHFRSCPVARPGMDSRGRKGPAGLALEASHVPDRVTRPGEIRSRRLGNGWKIAASAGEHSRGSSCEPLGVLPGASEPRRALDLLLFGAVRRGGSSARYGLRWRSLRP